MSHASDVYGSNMTQRQARAAIGNIKQRVSSRPVRAASVRVAFPTARALPRPDGHCKYVGQSWEHASCSCICHYGGECDTALGRGQRCDGSPVR